MPTNMKSSRNRITLSVQSLISSLDDQESFLNAVAVLHIGEDNYRLSRYGTYVEDGLLYEVPIVQELIESWKNKFDHLAKELGVALEVDELFAAQDEENENG